MKFIIIVAEEHKKLHKYNSYPLYYIRILRHCHANSGISFFPVTLENHREHCITFFFSFFQKSKVQA